MKRALFKRFVSVIVAVAICIGGLGLTTKNVFAYNAGIEAVVNSLQRRHRSLRKQPVFRLSRKKC